MKTDQPETIEPETIDTKKSKEFPRAEEIEIPSANTKVPKAEELIVEKEEKQIVENKIDPIIKEDKEKKRQKKCCTYIEGLGNDINDKDTKKKI